MLAPELEAQPRRGVFLAIPKWHEQLASPNFTSWSVPHFLLRYLQGNQTERASSPETASAIYLAVYVHGDLSPTANQLNLEWLQNDTRKLPLADGSLLDLDPYLPQGNVFMTAFGPEQCQQVRGD